MKQLVPFNAKLKLFCIAMLVFAVTDLQTVTFAEDKAETAFEQPEFAIGFWVDPPLDDKADIRYKEIADANFTLVLGGFGVGEYGKATPQAYRRQVDLCNKYGMNVLLWTGDKKVSDFPNDAVCWGYMTKDEPSTEEFQELAEIVKCNRLARPDKMTFINLFPNYASLGQLKAKDYDEYLAKFIQNVQPQVLCMDHYPRFKPGCDDPRPKYRKNLESLKKAAEKADIPFWMFFNIMPYGSHTNPTEGQVRWQVYTSLAYGAKGLLYFCYYTPRGREFSKGGAIIDVNDRKTSHYWQAKRVNGELKKLGLVLMKLKPLNVLTLDGGKVYSDKALVGTPLTLLSVAEKNDAPMDVEIGTLKHQDGREAVMLVNNSITYAIWPTLEFYVPVEHVVEIDRQSGKEISIYDESPDIPGLQISLEPGDGRLFLVNKK